MRTSGIMKLTPAVSGLPSTRVSSLMSGDTSGFMLSSFSCTDGAQVEFARIAGIILYVQHRWKQFYLISFHEPSQRALSRRVSRYSIDCRSVTCTQNPSVLGWRAPLPTLLFKRLLYAQHYRHWPKRSRRGPAKKYFLGATSAISS